MTPELDAMKIPIRLVIVKPKGNVTSCGKRALLGWAAYDVMSELLVTSVAMLDMQDMIAVSIGQTAADPVKVAFWCMISPPPPALTRLQMRKVKPPMGATMALAWKNQRAFSMGSHIVGSDSNQKIMKPMKSIAKGR